MPIGPRNLQLTKFKTLRDMTEICTVDWLHHAVHSSLNCYETNQMALVLTKQPVCQINQSSQSGILT